MPVGSRQTSPLLAIIGSRVRAARKMNRLSRKALAERSGVSERHLAQLEAGAGNISILLLDRICDALGVQLSNLVASPRATGNAAKARRVALIGLRGAGKTTLGSAAAEQLEVPFAELNELIAEEAGLSAREIFALYGEDGYRRIEAKVLAGIADSTDTIVLTTGGGLVSKPDSFDFLLHRFHTIWLRATPEEHMARVKAQGDHRPMEGHPQAMGVLRDILDSRIAQYERADATLDTSRRPVEECVRELVAIARPWLGR